MDSIQPTHIIPKGSAAVLFAVLFGALPLACTDSSDRQYGLSPKHLENSRFNDGAGILNPSFEYWLDRDPLHWEITGGREPYVHRGDEFGVLETGPGFNYVQVSQRVDAKKSLGGATLRFSCLARAREKDTVKLILHLDDGTKFHSDRHEGDRSWQRLVVTAVIPESYAGNSVRLTLYHFGSPSKPAQFREPSITIE